MNRKLVLPVVMVAVIGAALFASSTAGAFTKLSPQRKWFVTPVPVDINKNQLEASIADGDNGETAILDAYNDPVRGWNGAGSGDLVFGYTTNLAAVQGDGFPTTEFNDPINICTGGCLAATLTGFFVQQVGIDEIVDADVYVDAQASFTSENEDSAQTCGANEFVIEGVLQHEVGHVLGLGHSNRAAATMFSFVNPCDFGTVNLANDDRNGINSLY